MDKEKLIEEAKRIKSLQKRSVLMIQAKEFIGRYAGKESEFFKRLNDQIHNWNEYEMRMRDVMDSFIEFTERGLLSKLSYEREVQIETVSDLLDQANELLKDKKIHPAAPTVIIGAALEEFLRNWLEEEGVDIEAIKKSIDSYSQELRKRDLINKQDSKDILSWAGSRNDAAHGNFDEVNDRNRIKLMLESVNLFIRKYTPE